jgi:hypothetical protein
LKRQEERLKNPKLGKMDRLRIQDLVEDIRRKIGRPLR